MIKCPCGFESDKQGDFSWQKVKGRLVLLCLGCASIIHRKHIAEGVE